jgi:hypothetical protein
MISLYGHYKTIQNQNSFYCMYQNVLGSITRMSTSSRGMRKPSMTRLSARAFYSVLFGFTNIPDSCVYNQAGEELSVLT